MPVLVVAEHNNAQLSAATRSAVTAANGLADVVHVLVAGSGCVGVAEEAAKVAGVNTVLLSDAPVYKHQLAEDMAPVVVSLAPAYGHIVAAATSTGKDLMPRIAALLDTQQVSDIVGIDSPAVYRRPIYAGSVYITVESTDPVKVITVRPAAFPPAQSRENAAPIEVVPPGPAAGLSEFVSETLTRNNRPDLAEAEIVVAGGRGIGSAANFEMLEKLADRLGAAIGASRAAVDAGYAPNELQVGQTGRVVAPRLYIAVGISGAIQHLAGMKDSRVIVAINKDEDAPIFQVADYGIVGDLFKVLPELTRALDE